MWGLAGQSGQPIVLGTTVFEHALSRTSGNPLRRTSGSPSSPPNSFKAATGEGASGAATGGLPGTCGPLHPILAMFYAVCFVLLVKPILAKQHTASVCGCVCNRGDWCSDVHFVGS